MSEKKESGNGKFVLGAIFGAIAGTVAGVVLAPKSGEETRKDIKSVSDKYLGEAKRKGSKWFKRGKQEVKKLEAETRTTAEKKKAEAEKAAKEVAEKISEKKNEKKSDK